MADRLKLQSELVKVLGSKSVYFQPPESIALEYPCIIYNLNNIENSKADDKTYKRMRGYLVTVIGRDPDEVHLLSEKILDRFEYIAFDRTYIMDNLYHNVLMLYY